MSEKLKKFSPKILIIYILFTLCSWIICIKLSTMGLIGYSKLISSFIKGICTGFCCFYITMLVKDTKFMIFSVIAAGFAIAAFDPPSFERLWLLFTSWLILAGLTQLLLRLKI